MPDKSKAEDMTLNEYGPKLDRIDSSSGRFREVSPKEAWVPGLIEVVFQDPAQSGVKNWHFPDEKERKEFSKAWPEDLKKVLRANELVSWQPSFPLRYPWTNVPEDKEAFEDYQKSGRDKFVTFRFQRNANTRRIADQLRKLHELEQAVAVPRVGPPSAPHEEPFMGRDDQPMAMFCDDNGCLESQWYMFRCNVNKAWQKTNASGEGLSGKGIIIADIDWGFNTYHDDLRNRIKETQNIFLNPADPTNVSNGDRLYHGTAALGIAGGEVNSQGVAGVAFGADLWAIQAGLDDIEHCRWVAGINFVRSRAAKERKVIILEVETIIGGNIEMLPTIAQEIRLAIADKIVVCVPAGNGLRDAGIGDDNRPIPSTGSILVGATNFGALENIRGISNSGCRVVVYAPGDPQIDVACGASYNSYLPGFGGTSSAVAKVAGVVALMLEENPALTHAQVRDILGQSQIPVFELPSNPIGVLVDAEQAVYAASQLAC